MKHRLQDAFDKIHAEPELKSHTMEFLANNTNKYRKRRLLSSKRLIATAACFILLLSAGMGYSVYLTPTFAISIDINPSIELGINRFDKVVSVETYNEDGYAVMSAMDVYYLDYKDALGLILADKGMKEYMVQDQLIAVTVFGRNEDKNNEMLDDVAACTASYANVHCSSGNSKEVAAAHEAGMSFGKYKAFLELQALDPDITAEDIQGLTMRQIWDMIDELSGNIDGTNRNGNTGGCGSEQHTGHGSGQGRNRGHGRGFYQQEGAGK